MKRIISIAVSALVCSAAAVFFVLRASSEASALRSKYVSFDQAMHRAEFPHIFNDRDNCTLYEIFKHVYEKNNFQRITTSSVPRVKKVIHHVWLGAPLCEEFKQLRQTWVQFHPQWKFVFWVDAEHNFDLGNQLVHSFDELNALLDDPNNHEQFFVVDVRGLKFPNRLLYDAAINYGESSDILKYQIVYECGGVYVDTDFECLAPFDLLHHTYDFYTGLQPLDTNRVQLGAALFAARQKHPILNFCIKSITNNQHIPHIVAKTGPIHFTRSVAATIGKTGLCDIVLPTDYLYPEGYEQRFADRSVWMKPHAFAVHHWAGSWLKPEAFITKK